MMQWQLILPDGRPLPLTGETYSVGRDADNDIVLEDEGVSRRHARIALGQGRVALMDLHSTNGTFVNGVPVRRQVMLDAGDEIGFGDTVRVRLAMAAGPRPGVAQAGRLVGSGRAVALSSGIWHVGRDAECRIAIDHPDVSRHHAELQVTDGRVLVQDKGSTNGTFVNGARVGSAWLTDGARVAFGPCAFVYQAAAQQAAPTRVAPAAHQAPMADPAPAAPPVPPQAQKGRGGALGWVLFVTMVLLVVGAWWAYEEGLFDGAPAMLQAGGGGRAAGPDPAAEAARKRREAEQLQRQATALAADTAFLERLASIQRGSETSVQYLQPVAQGMSMLVHGVEQVAGHRLGAAALRRANLDRIPDQLRALERDMEGLVTEMARMVRTTATLRQQLAPLRDGGDKQRLQAIGPTARDAARQAAALSNGIGSYRRGIEQNVRLVRQAADVATQLRIPLAGLLHDFAQPAAAAAERLGQLERLIDRDLTNFRLLERAAAAAAAL